MNTSLLTAVLLVPHRTRTSAIAAAARRTTSTTPRPRHASPPAAYQTATPHVLTSLQRILSYCPYSFKESAQDIDNAHNDEGITAASHVFAQCESLSELMYRECNARYNEHNRRSARIKNCRDGENPYCRYDVCGKN